MILYMSTFYILSPSLNDTDPLNRSVDLKSPIRVASHGPITFTFNLGDSIFLGLVNHVLEFAGGRIVCGIIG